MHFKFTRFYSVTIPDRTAKITNATKVVNGMEKLAAIVTQLNAGS